MRNQPSCGDMAKLVENLDRPISYSFASLRDFIHKIVTRTEILALISLQSDTNFKRYKPILGDLPKIINNLESCWVPCYYDIDQHLVTPQLIIIY